MARHTVRPFAAGNGFILMLLGLGVLLSGGLGVGLFCLVAGAGLVAFSRILG